MDHSLIGTEQSQPVVLVGGTKGFKRGLISFSESFLMLASGGGFVKTYKMLMQGQGESSYSIFSAFLSLCRSEVLEPGDCGSWVVNYDTNEAHGHVVGSDAFGEAYVIPLHSTLAQRRKRLEAAWVRLPRQFEVTAWLSYRRRRLSSHCTCFLAGAFIAE